MNLNQIKEFYRTHQLQNDKIMPINWIVLNYINSLTPESIFEFGCNQGKNLYWLEERGYDKVYGIDIGNISHPKTDWGDEKTLATIPDKSFDISFTNSVLNHIPLEEVVKIIYHLKRISNVVVLGESMMDIDNERWFNHDYEFIGFKRINQIEYAEDRRYGLYTSLES